MEAPINPNMHPDAPTTCPKDVTIKTKFPIKPLMKYIDKNHCLFISSSKNFPKKYNPNILKNKCDAFACKNKDVNHLHASHTCFPEKE